VDFEALVLKKPVHLDFHSLSFIRMMVY
jgi:hypothetical protein